MPNVLMELLPKSVVFYDVPVPYICCSLYLKYHSLSFLANLSRLKCHFLFQVILVITSLLHLSILSHLFLTAFVHLSVSPTSL